MAEQTVRKQHKHTYESAHTRSERKIISSRIKTEPLQYLALISP